MSCLQNDIILENLYEEYEEILRHLFDLTDTEPLGPYLENLLRKTVELKFEQMG